MKKNSICLVLLLCAMLLGGCSADGTSGQTGKESQDKSGTQDMQSKTTLEDGASASDGSTQVQSDGITEQEALAVALTHAGVKEDNVTSQRIQRDYEDGKEVYDIEFYADGNEYEYEIGVTDGSVVKADFEVGKDSTYAEKNQNNKKNTTDDGTDKKDSSKAGSDKEITKDEAKKIALAKVPGASNIQIEKDIEDGKVVYEGEIKYNNMEYEFEIDAATGKILSWDEDRDD